MKRPPLTVLSLALGAFLLPLLGGFPSVELSALSSSENLLTILFSGQKAPIASHLFVSLFFLVPLLHAFFTKRIIHVPAITITAGIALLAASIGISIAWSSFRHASAVSLLDWALMIGAYFAVTANAGRKQGVIVLWGYVLGVSVCALLGLMEFGEMRTFDPGYRISAVQMGPNQAGALFASGICLAIPLAFQLDRVPKLLAGLAIGLQVFALMLTQSKGAIICLPLGLIVLLLGVVILRPVPVAKSLGIAILPLLLGGLLTFAAQKSVQVQPGANGAAPLARFSNTGESANQSAGFRKLLWQTAIDLVKERPSGWGIGTYWYESSRPGRVTQTTFAHQTYLQLASEASILAPIGLFAFLGMIFVRGMRGAKSLAEPTKSLLIASFAGLSVAIAHNMIDSDMYFFGLGAMVFLLCGLVTSTSIDSQAPEFLFKLPRVAVAVAVVIAAPLGLSLSIAETNRAFARGAIAERNTTDALNHLNSAISSSISDGQALYLRGRMTNQIADLESACAVHPSPKFFRALADAYFAQGKNDAGFSTLKKAIERDRNNAPAMLRYMNSAVQLNLPDEATKMARQLINTESSTYFQIRSLPELVPTHTYEARVFLAGVTTNPQEKQKLLTEALKGYISYRSLTIPLVKRAMKVDPMQDVAGETRNTAIEKMNKGLEIISQLKPLQREAGLDLEVEEEAFKAILADLLK
jgi:tetratricopeptide (TPR) repeat protein